MNLDEFYTWKCIRYLHFYIYRYIVQ